MSTQEIAAAPATGKQGKQLRMFDLILFSVCAMLLLSQLTLSAQVGPTAIFWTVVVMILFFIPYSLITAELGSTYPDAGGIYSWVVRAFGSRWGTRVSWWYWINVALWVPSVYLMLSGVISSLFFDNELGFWWQIAITVALIWVNFWVNARSLETGTWVSNIGAIVTVGTIIVLAIAGGIYASNHGAATEWSMDSMLPTGGVHAIALALPIFIYNFLGFELMSSASADMQNPKKDVPKAIAIAGVLIGGFYLLSTWGMLQIMPAEEISETTGLIDALKIAIGDSTLGTVVVTALGIGALYCFFACLIPWTIGANLAAAESAREGDLPAIFAREHAERHTPIGAAWLTSIVGTIFTIGYGILFSFTDGAIDSLFWSLFAFSSVIFLLPYAVMIPAFLKLRKTDATQERPYRVPGGTISVMAMTIVPTILLLLASFFFIVDPFEPDWTTTISILAGLAITFILQEWFVRLAPGWKQKATLTSDISLAETPQPAD